MEKVGKGGEYNDRDLTTHTIIICSSHVCTLDIMLISVLKDIKTQTKPKLGLFSVFGIVSLQISNMCLKLQNSIISY